MIVERRVALSRVRDAAYGRPRLRVAVRRDVVYPLVTLNLPPRETYKNMQASAASKAEHLSVQNLGTFPVTGRFVFSEEYLKSVGSDLALNILCAVANPLGAEGMLRIVRGALKSRDLTKDLKAVTLPLVLLQVRRSTHDRDLFPQHLAVGCMLWKLRCSP